MYPTNRGTLTVLSLFWAALVPVPRPLSGNRSPAGDNNDVDVISSARPKPPRKPSSPLRRNLVWYSRGLVLLLLLVLVPDDPLELKDGGAGGGGGGSSDSEGVAIALWIATAWMVRVAGGLAAIVTHRILLRRRHQQRESAGGRGPQPQRREPASSPHDQQRTGGPLGPGGAKIWDAMAGATWVARSGLTLPPPGPSPAASSSGAAPALHYYLSWGRPVHEQPLMAWLGLAFLCLVVNGVLHLWSRLHLRRDQTIQHEGVADMVQSSVGRPLQWRDRTRLVYWSVANAVCEELTSRGVWRVYFEALLLRTTSIDHRDPHKKIRLYSNLCQAAVFGVGHYHGIPSGLVGVGLAFVYGLIMGFLADFNGGLGLAIIAHTVADFYIFAAVARSQLRHHKELAPWRR